MKVPFCGLENGVTATVVRASPDVREASRPLYCLSRGTVPAHVPSLAALTSDDDTQLSAELRLGQLRSQAAVIRTLADHVEHLARWGSVDGLREQIIEEMGRLGGQLLEAAAALTDLRRTP
jgi:hypothetical protein